MTLNRISFWMVSLFLCLALFAFGCGCGDDDDDDSGNDDDLTDDDNGTDDDSGDDDSGDDDSGDDDSGDDDSGDDDATDDDATDDDTTELFNIDFEDYSLGDLSSPWVVEDGGSSYAEILNDPTARTGKLLGIVGGEMIDDYVYATYSFTHTSDRVAISYQVYVPDNGSGGGTANVQFKQDASTVIGRLQLNGQLNNIYFDYLADNWNCGPFSFNTWYEARVEFDFANLTADVYINNTLTVCDDVPLNPNLTFDHLGQVVFSDFAGAGEGGVPYFDNFRATEWN